LSKEPTGITCMSCFQTFKDPQLLPCGHSICKDCIDRCVDLHNALKVSDKKEARRIIRVLTGKATEEDKKVETVGDVLDCPFCGEECLRSKVTPNVQLRNIISSNAFSKQFAQGSGEAGEKKTEVCGFCGKPATKFCCFCGPLCAEHNTFLHTNGPLGSHEVSDAPVQLLQSTADVKSAVVGRKSAQELDIPICRTHNSPMELFCSDCQQLVCHICAVSETSHKKHKIVSLEQAMKVSCKKVKDLVSSIEGNLEKLSKTGLTPEIVNASHDSERDALLKSITDFFGQMHKLVSEMEQKSRSDVEQTFDMFRDVMRKRLAGAEFLQKESRRLLEVAKPLSEEAKSSPEESILMSMNEFMLIRSLEGLSSDLDRFHSLAPPEEGGPVCKLSFSEEVKKSLSSAVRISPVFAYGGGSVSFVPINFDTIARSRSVEAFRVSNSGAHDGGAALDPSSRVIVATCGNYDNGRSLSIIRLPTAGYEGATTEARTDIVPFGTHGQYVVADGEGHFYFFQSEDGPNNHMGRLDIETMTFEELASLPGSEFREFSSGCFSNGHIYMMDEHYNIWSYDPTENTWTDVRVTLPRSGRLLADPCDPDNIYCICSDDRGVHRINVVENREEEVCRTPGSFSLGANNDAALVRVSPDVFAIFARCGGSWQVYNSGTNTWTRLPEWRDTNNGSGHIVVDAQEGFIYYHSDGNDNFFAVNLTE